MNTGSSRLIAFLLVLVLLGGMVYVALTQDGPVLSSKLKVVDDEVIDTSREQAKKDAPLILWYTDESLTDYLNSMALAYQEETQIKVTPVLMSGVEYLEQINRASVDNKDFPDLYITSNDNLLKAYYAGLAEPIQDKDQVVIPKNYPQTALHAVACDDSYVAYPFYYETNFFLYNKTFMADLAKKSIETEADLAEGMEATANIEAAESEEAAADVVMGEDDANAEVSQNQLAEGTDEEQYELSQEVLTQMSTMIPSTINDILAFADNYDAPETVENVFKWDVSDIFYNYFFVGNYIDVGGEDGDNNASFHVYNQETIDCLQVYQDLNQFFSIDSKAVTYDTILEEFIQGKTVFTVATTDAIAKIEEAKSKGEFDYEYGVAVLPNISDKLVARGLSVTNGVVINGYSNRPDQANAFAKYLTYENLDTLYKRSEKIACRYGLEYDNPEINNTMLEYQKSVSMPKMIEASNFWMQLEITFTKIWNGSDPESELVALAELIGSQIDEIGYDIPEQESISAGADSDVK
ncbi:MAG: extracellular solute-binding protein [Clostridia bacterium]|nr:extracellular solute-binding protein [Clostridia bacterium]